MVIGVGDVDAAFRVDGDAAGLPQPHRARRFGRNRRCVRSPQTGKAAADRAQPQRRARRVDGGLVANRFFVGNVARVRRALGGLPRHERLPIGALPPPFQVAQALGVRGQRSHLDHHVEAGEVARRTAELPAAVPRLEQRDLRPFDRKGERGVEERPCRDAVATVTTGRRLRGRVKSHPSQADGRMAVRPAMPPRQYRHAFERRLRPGVDDQCLPRTGGQRRDRRGQGQQHHDECGAAAS
jgi:hypothetical protein